MINREAVYAAIMILLIGAAGYLMATNERAMDACQKSYTAETCEYIFR